MKTYDIKISEFQRFVLQEAMTILCNLANDQRAPTIRVSDPAPEGHLGNCIGEEIEALRDMLAPGKRGGLGALMESGAGLNDFTA